MIEQPGGCHTQLPIPNAFDPSQQMTKFAHIFMSAAIDGAKMSKDMLSGSKRVGIATEVRRHRDRTPTHVRRQL